MKERCLFVFSVGNMRRVILDLFFAGSETTSTTLDWAFLYMAEFPEVQRRCQQEIEEVVTQSVKTVHTNSTRQTLPVLQIRGGIADN